MAGSITRSPSAPPAVGSWPASRTITGASGASFVGSVVGVAVGSGVLVGSGVAVGVGDGVAVSVSVADAVAARVGVKVGADKRVAVGAGRVVADGVAIGAGAEVAVATTATAVGVAVAGASLPRAQPDKSSRQATAATASRAAQLLRLRGAGIVAAFLTETHLVRRLDVDGDVARLAERFLNPPGDDAGDGVRHIGCHRRRASG